MPLRILIVEDDPLQRALLAAFLQTRGHYIDTSEDGLDALRKCRLGWFNVVIMDYRLPEIDGLTAAKLIGDFDLGEGRPVIIALSGTTDLLQVDAAGPEIVFDAVVQKPWNGDVLLETIARCRRERCSQAAQSAAGAAAPAPDAGWEHHVYASAAPGPAERAVATSTDPNTGAARVLIVDDDVVFRGVLATALSSKGLAVDSAARGLEALRMIRRSHYDVAILDYRLSDIDGLAIARLTHELVRGTRCPRLIALTASPEELNSREAGLLSAFDNVIRKSLDLQSIVSIVELSLAYKKLRPNPEGLNIFQSTETLSRIAS